MKADHQVTELLPVASEELPSINTEDMGGGGGGDNKANTIKH